MNNIKIVFRRTLYRDQRSLRIYYNRCNKLFRAFGVAVEKLETYSTRHSRTFFSYPLKWAKTLRDMNRDILRGLSSETPNLRSLRSDSNAMLSVKQRMFNPMGRIASIYLWPEGFTKSKLFVTYNGWQMIDRNEIKFMEPAFLPPNQSHFSHDQFLKLFVIEDIDIFDHPTQFEIEEYHARRPTYAFQMPPPENNQVFDPPVKGNSGSNSPALTTSDEDYLDVAEADYCQIGQGEFRDFEESLIIVPSSRH